MYQASLVAEKYASLIKRFFDEFGDTNLHVLFHRITGQSAHCQTIAFTTVPV
jgi:hypothetical protein